MGNSQKILRFVKINNFSINKQHFPKNWQFSEDSFTNKLVLYPNEYYCIKQAFVNIKRVIDEKMPLYGGKSRSVNHKTNHETEKNKKPKKNVKLLFLKIHKEQQQEQENQELDEILSRFFNFIFYFFCLNCFFDLALSPIAIWSVVWSNFTL